MNQAALRLWPALVKARIRPEIYGHFAEHVGRGIYEGIWVGPRSRIPNTDGLRVDVIAALKQLRAPVLRWPGGCFANEYHWRDGIGPPANRPATANLRWQESEPNEFGTEEFMALCRKVGCAPYLCCNVGTGTAEEARSWAEYCNFVGESSLTRLRAEQGASEPHGASFWGVGHEPWGCGGGFTPEAYAAAYARYATFVRLVDPGIQLIAAGCSPGDSTAPRLDRWNHDFCAHMPQKELIDHLSIQRYFNHGADFSVDGFRALFADVQALEKDIARTEAVLAYYYPDKPLGIAVDAWGMRHAVATAENGLQQRHPLRDALLAGSVLNLFNQWSHRVAMANLAQAVNVLHGLAMTEGPELVLSPTYYVFDMMRPHMGARLITQELEAPTFPPEGGDEAPRDVCALSASASISGKRVLLTVTNQTPDQDIEVHIALREADIANVTGRVLTSDDPRDANTADGPRQVAARRLSLSGEGGSFVHVFPRHSFTALRFTLG
ncbi:MAG: alpha-N-arabinofuranosidase [Candidatus Hydrogenedentota bacterium]